MTRTSFDFRKTIRFIFGGMLLLLAVLLGIVAAVVSFKPITEVISALSQNGYDVYFYDQIGGGLSGRLKNIREYRLSRHVADLDQIRNKINAEQIILIGESFGGTLATKFMSLVSGGMACDPKTFPENHNLLIGFWALLIPDELPEPANKAVKIKLGSMTLPVLILKGGCDYIKWEVTYEYKSLLKNATLLFLEGAGHLPFLEKPDLVLDSIRSFLLDELLPLPPYTGDLPPRR